MGQHAQMANKVSEKMLNLIAHRLEATKSMGIALSDMDSALKKMTHGLLATVNNQMMGAFRTMTYEPSKATYHEQIRKLGLVDMDGR